MQPVFIGGVGRSGTTLLADILGFHPEITPVYETDFVLSLMRIVSTTRSTFERTRRIRTVMDEWTQDLPRRPDSKRSYERFAHGAHHLHFGREFVLAQTERLVTELDRPIPALRRFVEALFAEHCRVAGKPRWVNKTPGYLQFLNPLHMVFRDLLFVHIVRDGRDVAASMVTRPWGPSSVVEAGRQWSDALGVARAFAEAHPEQLVQVRYEELLCEPERALKPVFEAMGLPMPADLVERYVARMGPFDTTRIGAHQETYSDRDHARFLEVAGEALEATGYDVELATA